MNVPDFKLNCEIILCQENINGTSTFGASCREYYERGFRRNGTFSIRPNLSRSEIQILQPYDLYIWHIFRTKIPSEHLRALNTYEILNDKILNFKLSHSFKVECMFGLKHGLTIIHPTDQPEGGFQFPENESQRCLKANCFKRRIQYGPSTDQIKTLIALSTNCTQKITHNCNFNGLSGLSSWISSNGTTNSYWHGNRNSGTF